MMKKNFLRNVQINGTSPLQDVLSAIDGIWSSTVINDWYDIHISSRLEIWNRWCNEKGSYLLPRVASNTLMAKIFNNDGSVSCSVIQIGQAAISVSKPCYIEVMIVLES